MTNHSRQCRRGQLKWQTADPAFSAFAGPAAAHGVTALDAIRDALAGKPWLPPLPAAA